jgi:predicted nucleotidyltransferase
MEETLQNHRPGETCDEVLACLRAHLPDLAEQFGVSGVALFGPAARGEAEPGSEIDLMVVLSRPLGWDLVLLHDHLESILGVPVDLAVRGGLMRRPGIWDELSRQLVYVGPDDGYSAR